MFITVCSRNDVFVMEIRIQDRICICNERLSADILPDLSLQKAIDSSWQHETVSVVGN